MAASFNLFTVVLTLITLGLGFFLVLNIKKVHDLALEREKLTGRIAGLEQTLVLTKESAESSLHEISSQLEDKNAQILHLKEAAESRETELRQSACDTAALKSAVQSTTSYLEDLKAKLAAAENKIAALINEKEDLHIQNQSLRSDIQYAKELSEQTARMQEQGLNHLKTELQALGEKMLKERAGELNTLNQTQFTSLVAPLQQELKNFQNIIASQQKTHSEQAGALKTELLRLQETQVKVSTQSEELIKALRGGHKSQGMWGEHQLEMCLEAAGLREGFEYEREVCGSRALNETGRPDVILRLPKNHCLIIDAKCSLTAYTNLINADNDEDIERYKKAHLTSIRSHVTELAKKSYDSYQSFHSPSFVFMFVPIDGALETALNFDAALYQEACAKHIYLVSPSTLIPALRVVANLWVLATQNERLSAISREAENIYKKALSLQELFEKLNKQYQTLGTTLEKANGAFFQGKGNLLSQMQRFQAKTPSLTEELELPEVYSKEVPGQVKQEQPQRVIDLNFPNLGTT